MNLIFKWLIYTKGDNLLRPHFSWNFHIVDCTEYKKEEEIRELYSEEITNTFLEWLSLEYEGETYYECEYSPIHTEWMELLSDISDIEYYDEETSF